MGPLPTGAMCLLSGYYPATPLRLLGLWIFTSTGHTILHPTHALQEWVCSAKHCNHMKHPHARSSSSRVDVLGHMRALARAVSYCTAYSIHVHEITLGSGGRALLHMRAPHACS